MRNKSILLVDDEQIILHSIGRDLRMQDYVVTLAANGEDAINLLKCNQFELVVTDISMQGLDGIQVLKEAKKISSIISVIILTGYGDMVSAIDALRLGADDYLLKPCDPDELVMRIERCLEKQEAFQKVRFYEKILPVCMYCKSIRDDSGTEPGKGEWLTMEKYIYHMSGTDISHGICPGCYEKHFND